MNFVDPLAAHAARTPDKAAIVTGGETLTYAGLADGTDRIAAGLRGLGLGDGEAVGLMIPTGLPSVVATLAAIKAGLVYVGINVMFRSGEVRQVLADCGARVVIAHVEYLDIVTEAIAEQTAVEHVIVVGGSGDLTYEELLERPVDGDQTRAVDPSARAALFYTGGTTGAPKGVIHDHQNLVNHMTNARRMVGLSDEDRVIGMGATFIGTAFVATAWSALAHGAELFLMERFDAAEAVQLIEEEKITFSWGSVAVFQRMNALPYDRDLSCMWRSIAGGYAHPAAVRSEFEERFGATIYHSWGMSETVGSILMQPPGDEETRCRKMDSVGRSMGGVEVCVQDDDDRILATGEPGELCVRADDSGLWKPALGYLNNPEETERAFRGGWLHTNDLATIDSDGWVTVEGRRGDLIKVSGWAVFATEIEELIAGDERVETVAVVAVPDERTGQRPVAFVELKEGRTATAEEVVGQVDRSLAKFKRLKSAVIVDELPTNLYGKVQKNALVERYAEETYTD